jgi:hypothetical protein
MRDQPLQLARAFRADDVAGSAAHQQCRDADAPRGLLAALLLHQRLASVGMGGTLKEAGIPVPVPAPVLALPQVLAQAGGAARLAVRIVGGDRLRRFGQAGKTVGVRAHEGEHARHAVGLEAGRNVDQHERAGKPRRPLADREQGGQATHRGADQYRRRAQRSTHAGEVADHRIGAVVAVRHPLAVAVAAGIQGDGQKAGLGESQRGAGPGVARLAAAVQEDDRRRLRGTGLFGGEDVAVSAHEFGDAQRCAGSFVEHGRGQCGSGRIQPQTGTAMPV